jgi:hypothetical protein
MLLAILILFFDIGTTNYQILILSDIDPFKQKIL